jgi:hypothetical protein
MICPHCSRSVRYRSRGNRKCGYCGQRFALEPKQDPFRLSDMRLRNLDAKLSEGRLWYTSTQLWYAAARKELVPKRPSAVRKVMTGVFVVVSVLPFIACMLLTVRDEGINATGVVIFGAVLVISVFATARAIRAGRRRTSVSVPHGEFRRRVLEPWVGVYGAEPPALIPEARPVAPQNPANPTLVVLCPDPAVLACLHANAIGTRLNVAVLARAEEAPPDVPVALLHDTSVDGYLFGAWVRGRLAARRVFDIGPRPRTVKESTAAIRLRGRRPASDPIERLRAARVLTEPELAWLADGWWSPVAALRPKALVDRITEAVERVGNADPDRRAASALGFLTWPGR